MILKTPIAWWAETRVVADAPGRTLGLRGRLVDVGIGVADKERYGTGILGSGDSGGWRSQGAGRNSVDQPARSLKVAEESGIVRAGRGRSVWEGGEKRL